MKNKRYMERALELAYKGRGYTNPNPIVGAVIVKNGKIIGEGYHKKYGDAHAEVEAFNNAVESPEGADMYVTLEPCAHYGKTPPCAERIVKEKIKKVYIALKDPNEKVSGKGIEILKNAGIKVEIGMLEEKCREANEIFLHYITNKKPFVIAKWAMTLDGKIASKTGDSKWISSEKSRQYVHKLRQKVSAIVVGKSCAIKDNPMLNVRLNELGGDECNPTRIILSSDGNVPKYLKLIQTAREIPTIVACIKISEEDRSLLESYGVEILVCKEVNQKVCIKDLIQKLGDRGIDSVLIEGGGEVLASAFEENVINRVVAFIAPKIVGGRNAVSPVEGNGLEFMKLAKPLKNVKIKNFDKDVCIKGDIECSLE